MSKLRERVIEKHLRLQCRANGMLCLKFTSPSSGGVPDRIVVTPSQTVFVEVKRPGEDLEPRQRAVHEKMRRFGAVIFVVATKQEVDQLIQMLLAHTADHLIQELSSQVATTQLNTEKE